MSKPAERSDGNPTLSVDFTDSDGKSGGFVGKRAAVLVLSFLLLYTFAADVHKASRRPFWFDEVCTLAVAGRQTLPAVWDALAVSADGNPPLFYVLEGAAKRLTSNEQIGYRLESIAGVICISVCLFFFIRARIGPSAGLVAAIFPLLTSVGIYYATEARPYGMLMGCVGLTLLAWDKADRAYGGAILAILLAIAVSLHYLAVFVFVPFAAGEATRWIRTGRFRPALWLALLVGALPLAVYWPLLAHFKSVYGSHFWETPKIADITHYYDHIVDMGIGFGAGLAAVVGIGLFAILLLKRGDNPSTATTSRLEDCAVILTFLLLPIIGCLATKMVHSGFTYRYALAGVLGISMAMAYMADWAGERAKLLLIIFLLAVLSVREVRYWAVEARGPATVPAIPADVTKSAAAAGLPLVVSNLLDYLPLAYYDRDKSHFLVLVDPSRVLHYLRTDAVDIDLLLLSRLLPLNVQTFSAFAPQHSRFLLYSRSGDEWSWLPDRLKDDGDVVKPILVHQDHTLFLVELRTSALPSQP
jgi:nitrate reductase gamma subunit